VTSANCVTEIRHQNDVTNFSIFKTPSLAKFYLCL